MTLSLATGSFARRAATKKRNIDFSFLHNVKQCPKKGSLVVFEDILGDEMLPNYVYIYIYIHREVDFHMRDHQYPRKKTVFFFNQPPPREDFMVTTIHPMMAAKPMDSRGRHCEVFTFALDTGSGAEGDSFHPGPLEVQGKTIKNIGNFTKSTIFW